MKKFIVRTLTALVYVALLAGCTLMGPISAFLFFALVSVACIWEFTLLMNRHYEARLTPYLLSITGFLLSAAVWLAVIGGADVEKAFGLYGLVLLYLLLSELYRKAADPIKHIGIIFASQFYIALPFALLPLLCVVRDAEENVRYMSIYPMSLFVFIWLNDTGAYLAGSLLHRYFSAPLFPRISPNKSWVGSIGGGLLTLAASVVIWHFFPDTFPLWKWMGFAAVVVLFGTWGDLLESLIKRQLMIKDSGHILPGHGGMLDRFDSSLIAIPAAVLYFLFVG